MSSDYWYDGSQLSISYPGYTYTNYFNNYEASYDFLSVGDLTCMSIDQIYGCTDTNAANYDNLSLIDNGSCIEQIYGCTNETALNYNVEANTDDGSCEYPVVDNPCDITPSGLFVDNIIHERVAFNLSILFSFKQYFCKF